MASDLKVSIVTPSYNQGAYIEKTIKSVLNQNYDNLEYLIIDGGSTDTSIDTIKKYEQDLKYWISEKDHGQSDAINKGWRIAEGEIIAYLNSDDTLEPSAIQQVVQEFKRCPQVGIVYGNCNVISENDAYLGLLRGNQLAFEQLLIHGQKGVWQPAAFFNAEIVRKLGFLNESWEYCMDYDLILRISEKSQIKYVDYTLANHRMYTSTKSLSQAENHWKEKIAVKKQFLDKIPFTVYYNYYLFKIFNRLPEWITRLIRKVRRNPFDKAVLNST